MVVYMKVTTDKYELPVAIADSVKELAEKVGVKACSIYSNMSHYKNGAINKSPYVKVVIDNDSR